MKIEKWYRQNATSRRLLAQKSTEKSGNRQRKPRKRPAKQLRWREFYRTYWRRKESGPQKDDRNVREDGSQRRCYACGHIWINVDGKSAVWGLNEDRATRKAWVPVPKAAGMGRVVGWNE